ncbi:hypothetical protein F5146DRAFT_1217759 [Armillaria mellea]|nr:hypothetical protein F5146DRAFT_1217759 [Armillaria mellea]
MNHPPDNCYFTFSIDVATTLDLYCDGGDDAMLQKLSGLRDRVYAGYCVAVECRSNRENKFNTTYIRPVHQGLTKPYRRKSHYARPAMCIPILPETVHPRSREALRLSKPLPWSNCYHPTCYDVRARIPSERRDYSQSPRVMSFSPQIVKPLAEDSRYYRLLQSGLDEDQVLRIMDGQEDVPDTGHAPETDTQSCHMFFANIPGCEELEEDRTFLPVLRIDSVLSNVREISDPSQLWEDRDLFAEIVEEYQLERYGPVIYDDSPIEDEPLSDSFSVAYSLMSAQSGTSTDDLGLDSRELDSSSEESPKPAGA